MEEGIFTDSTLVQHLYFTLRIKYMLSHPHCCLIGYCTAPIPIIFCHLDLLRLTTETKPKPKPKPKPKQEPKPKTNTKSKPKPKAKLESKPKPKSNTKPKQNPKSKPKQKLKPVISSICFLFFMFGLLFLVYFFIQVKVECISGLINQN